MSNCQRPTKEEWLKTDLPTITLDDMYDTLVEAHKINPERPFYYYENLSPEQVRAYIAKGTGHAATAHHHGPEYLDKGDKGLIKSHLANAITRLSIARYIDIKKAKRLEKEAYEKEIIKHGFIEEIAE